MPTTTNSATRKPIKSNQKKTILYIEDNSSNKALVDAIIQRQPHLKLDFANTIKDARNYLAEVTPALLLIDLHLPDGSGETLVKTLKADPKYAHIPIMILSADALPETIARLEAAGVDHYLTKPLDVAVFTKHLRKLTEA